MLEEVALHHVRQLLLPVDVKVHVLDVGESLHEVLKVGAGVRLDLQLVYLTHLLELPRHLGRQLWTLEANMELAVLGLVDDSQHLSVPMQLV